MAGRGKRRGNSLIEFTLLGVPLLFIVISIVAVSIDMWEFHNLAYASELTARYISMRCDWKKGPSSQSRPSHFRLARMPSTSSGRLRSASVSSTRRINTPPSRRA